MDLLSPAHKLTQVVLMLLQVVMVVPPSKTTTNLSPRSNNTDSIPHNIKVEGHYRLGGFSNGIKTASVLTSLSKLLVRPRRE